MLEVSRSVCSRQKIDQTEVSIAEYAKFVSATGYVTKAEQLAAWHESGWVKIGLKLRQLGIPSDPKDWLYISRLMRPNFFVNGKQALADTARVDPLVTLKAR